MIGLRANFHLPLGERGTFANYDRLRTYRVRERKKSYSRLCTRGEMHSGGWVPGGTRLRFCIGWVDGYIPVTRANLLGYRVSGIGYFTKRREPVMY